MQELLHQPARRWALQIRGQLRFEPVGILKRKARGVAFQKEVERVDDRQVGHQIDRERQLARALREHEAGDVVAIRILLPVDEVLLRQHRQRVGQHRRASMRCRPEPDLVRRQRDEPVVPVARLVVESDADTHGTHLRRRQFGVRNYCIAQPLTPGQYRTRVVPARSRPSPVRIRRVGASGWCRGTADRHPTSRPWRRFAR